MGRYGYEMEDLVPVVAGLADEYTGNEHSSVTYEKAQMLMEAVLYCIAEYESSFVQEEKGKEEGDGLDAALLQGNKASAKEACERGREIVLAKVRRLREFYNGLILGFQDYGLTVLRDTVGKGLPLFFLKYDVKYAPQETVLAMDYPVLKDLSGLSGVDAVWEYMKCIAVEQRFLKKLPTVLAAEMLREYHEAYEGLIENICGMVLWRLLAGLVEEEGKPLWASALAATSSTEASMHGPSNPKDKQQALELLLKGKVGEISEGDREIMDYLEGAVSDAAGRAVRIF